jgi:hypothetical protein
MVDCLTRCVNSACLASVGCPRRPGLGGAGRSPRLDSARRARSRSINQLTSSLSRALPVALPPRTLAITQCPKSGTRVQKPRAWQQAGRRASADGALGRCAGMQAILLAGAVLYAMLLAVILVCLFVSTCMLRPSASTERRASTAFFIAITSFAASASARRPPRPRCTRCTFHGICAPCRWRWRLTTHVRAQRG